GLAFSEDADFDDLDDLGHRAGRGRNARSVGFLASRHSRYLVGIVAALVLVVGSRHLIGSPMPVVGQFAPFPDWTALWHQFFSSWQPAGAGSNVPASPAFGFLGLAGTVLFGRSGLLQQVVVLACVPLGVWGMSRLLRPFGSPRGRLAAVITYLALPLAVDALARGRWDGLVAFAATPWVVLQLARATRLDPYGPSAARAVPVAEPTGTAGTAPAARAERPVAWRQSLAGRALLLGALEAVAMSFAPAMAIVVLVSAFGLVCGSFVTGGLFRGARAVVVAVGGTVVAAVLCTPWVVGTLLAGRDALGVFGLAVNPTSAPGWGGLLRMAVGPVGASPLAWLLLAAALPVLLLARGPRLAWAIRLWAIAVPAWLLALVALKGWLVPFAPSVDVLLAPAAVAVAGAVGLGVMAFETDLVGYGFGWRQGAAVLSVLAIAAGVLPVVADAAGGRWGLPSSGYESAAGFRAVRPAARGYRVLWVGDPQALPSGGWSIGSGLAYATSTDGTPTLLDVWPPASPGRAVDLARALRVAMRGETVHLGRLLAAARVRYVVVVTALAPGPPGTAVTVSYPVPRGLDAALGRQEDLRTVTVSPTGLRVFQNTAFSPGPGGQAVTAGRPGGVTAVLDPLGAALELVAWAVVAAALLGRRRWLDWWWRPLLRARSDRRARRRRIVRVDVADGASG
ncbi:MAG TPA: hypothetical protein VMD28_04465, partial [Acidimicrobiales bacterium]|nr:hypothetical protein [Acidimicrobiales bacterium]